MGFEYFFIRGDGEEVLHATASFFPETNPPRSTPLPYIFSFLLLVSTLILLMHARPLPSFSFSMTKTTSSRPSLKLNFSSTSTSMCGWMDSFLGARGIRSGSR